MQVEFNLAGEITQVIDSIPWVRCASGNVLALYTMVCYNRYSKPIFRDRVLVSQYSRQFTEQTQRTRREQESQKKDNNVQMY